MSKVYYIRVKSGEPVDSLAGKTIKLLQKISNLDLIEKKSLVGIKIHFGEKGNIGYINSGIVKHIAAFMK